MKLNLKLLLLLSCIILSGCVHIREVHYFKDKISSSSSTKIIPNYYKVEIKGTSILSSSRYISGYFDQSAINLYFNEFTQPANGKLFGNQESPSAFTDENGNELVLIFSTNSKAVSDQIGAIAKNQVVLNSAAALVQKDKIEKAQQIKMDIADADDTLENFILQVDFFLNDSTATPNKKKEALIRLKNILEQTNE